MPELGGLDWTTLAIGLLVLVVVWTVARFVLRLTAQAFRLGCLALLILGAVLFALNWFGG